MKIYIFGSNGMLGTYLYSYLKNEFEVIPISRKEFDLNDDFSLIFEKYHFNDDDVVINAAGIIKQRNYSPRELIRINSVFPQFLSTLDCNVIHITTDCVFSGKDGFYDEDSLHDCLDDYGKSKSLGENNDLTIIRTSIIGEEIYNKKSLLEWVRGNRGKEINGYLNHFWNGVTCLELSKHVMDIIENKSYWKGVRHYFSPDIVSKYQLVSYINEIYELEITVNPVMEKYCNRSISTKYNSPIVIPIKEQIKELKEYGLISKLVSNRDKLKNFPTLNFISVEGCENRRKILYEKCQKYGITSIREHTYKRYEDENLVIELGDYPFEEYRPEYLSAFTSHFRAIKEWYQNTDEPYAIFCEDDIDFETVEYWNFTWDDFFNNLPTEWQCVQLNLTREPGTMFKFFNPSIKLRIRCYCDWSCACYLLTREHAKNLLDAYYPNETFSFSEYVGIDKPFRWQLDPVLMSSFIKPVIENYIYTVFGGEFTETINRCYIFTFPLFLVDNKIESIVWQEANYDYSHESILNWWKTTGKYLKIEDITNPNYFYG